MVTGTNDSILGIDLGTGNTVVVDGGTGEVLVPPTPSEVSCLPDGTLVFGTHPEATTTFSHFKRLIGKSADDILKSVEHACPYEIADGPNGRAEALACMHTSTSSFRFTPQELSTEVLRGVLGLAAVTVTPPPRAVVTCPAYFTDEQRRVTRNAASMAGLDVLRVVNEPTAAACVAFRGGEERVLVFDVGSGTTDVTIVDLSGLDDDDGHDSDEFVADVVATHGDGVLGGVDVDAALVVDMNITVEEAREKKHAGDYDPEVIRPVVSRMVRCVTECLIDAGLTHLDIDRVVLVGGSTRLRELRDSVTNMFGASKIDVSHDPDTTVAVGAAKIAASLARGRGALLMDVTPLTLGVETAGGKVGAVVPRGTRVPCRKTARFRAAVGGDGDDADDGVDIDIRVLEGERLVAEECELLGDFSFRLASGRDSRLELTFEVDESGILTIRAADVDAQDPATRRRTAAFHVRSGAAGADAATIRERVQDALDAREKDEREAEIRSRRLALHASIEAAARAGKNASHHDGTDAIDDALRAIAEEGVGQY